MCKFDRTDSDVRVDIQWSITSDYNIQAQKTFLHKWVLNLKIYMVIMNVAVKSLIWPCHTEDVDLLGGCQGQKNGQKCSLALPFKNSYVCTL